MHQIVVFSMTKIAITRIITKNLVTLKQRSFCSRNRMPEVSSWSAKLWREDLFAFITIHILLKSSNFGLEWVAIRFIRIPV